MSETDAERTKRRIYEHVGDDYPLLSLMLDLERAVVVETRAQAVEAIVALRFPYVPDSGHSAGYENGWYDGRGQAHGAVAALDNTPYFAGGEPLSASGSGIHKDTLMRQAEKKRRDGDT